MDEMTQTRPETDEERDRRRARYDTQRPLMKIQDVAFAWNMTVAQVRALRARGQMPEPIKIGRCLRWYWEEIHAWEGGEA